MRLLSFAVLGLAIAVGACASATQPQGLTEARSPAYQEKITAMAMAAAGRAAPSPPQTYDEVGAAMGYLSQHRRELFDANQDGRYGFVEWEASNFSAYLAYNVAKDGRLKKSEYVRFKCGPDQHPFIGCSYGTAPDISASRQAIERQFDRLDRGHKGYLTAGDLEAVSLMYFRANDVNRDGWVTDEEIAQVARGRR